MSKVQKVDKFKEHLFVIGLKANNQVRYVDLISIGSLTQTIVSMPSIFYVAIAKANVFSLILAHTHPSGSLQPSKSDIEITQKVVAAGKLLDIKILDHLIITDVKYYSFADEGMM